MKAGKVFDDPDPDEAVTVVADCDTDDVRLESRLEKAPEAELAVADADVLVVVDVVRVEEVVGGGT